MKPEDICNGTGVYGIPTKYRRNTLLNSKVRFMLKIINCIETSFDYQAFLELNANQYSRSVYSFDIWGYLDVKAAQRANNTFKLHHLFHSYYSDTRTQI